MTTLCLYATIMSLGLFTLAFAFAAIIPAYTFWLGVSAVVAAGIVALSFQTKS